MKCRNLMSNTLGLICLVCLFAASLSHAQGVAAKKDAKAGGAAKASVPAEGAKADAAGVNSDVDQRLSKALKAAGYKFDVMPQGVLRLYFEMGDGRSQQVFVASATQKTPPLETRKIWSTAMKREDQLPAAIANKLLMDNDKVAFGAWELTKWPDGYRVLFVAALPADLSPDALKVAIRVVFSKADLMEKELTKEDRF